MVKYALVVLCYLAMTQFVAYFYSRQELRARRPPAKPYVHAAALVVWGGHLVEAIFGKDGRYGTKQVGTAMFAWIVVCIILADTTPVHAVLGWSAAALVVSIAFSFFVPLRMLPSRQAHSVPAGHRRR